MYAGIASGNSSAHSKKRRPGPSQAPMTTISAVAGVFLIATVSQLQGLSQSTRHSLDLLPISSDDWRQNPMAWLGPPPTDHGVVPKFPFAIKILWVERATYELGDDIIYELELTNISGRTVSMPWLADSTAVTPKMAGRRRCC